MKKLFAIVMFLLFFSVSYTQEDKTMEKNPASAGLEGQLILQSNLNFQENLSVLSGLRYIPEFSAEYKTGTFSKFSMKASVNSYASLARVDNNFISDAAISPYRLWIRYNTRRLFLRAGLQKINFGSATLLRPLMWFDQIDARDPMQLTTGVYGLLGRYYFPGNTSIWLWGLYGNENRRGWDVYQSREKKPEWGGRMQTPAGPGEIALSFHHRKTAGFETFNHGTGTTLALDGFSQNRLGIDGKWDLGVGVWFENTLKNNNAGVPDKWNNLLNVGIDYTFNLGNGLNVLAEGLLSSRGDHLKKLSENSLISALSVNYPLGLFDRISAIFYYSYEYDALFRFASWNRQYDKWVFYVMAYWNPENISLGNFSGEEMNFFYGKGFQLMLVFNH